MLKLSYRGFSLIELMVVIAIVGILSGAAVSIYVSYSISSRVTEAMKVLDEYQIIANDLRSNKGDIAPYYVLFTDEDTSGFVSGTPSGTSAVKQVDLEYVDKVEAYSGTSGSNKYILLGVGLKHNNFIVSNADHIYIAGIETPTGVVTWSCGTSTSKGNNLDTKYLPKSCQSTLP